MSGRLSDAWNTVVCDEDVYIPAGAHSPRANPTERRHKKSIT